LRASSQSKGVIEDRESFATSFPNKPIEATLDYAFSDSRRRCEITSVTPSPRIVTP
jgi:hypothetical protein